MGRLFRLAGVIGLLLLGAGCTGDPDAADEPGDDEEASEGATAAGTVYSLSLKGCSTSIVRALTDQLVGEIACAAPGSLSSIESIPNVELDPEVVPMVQTPLVKALADAALANGKPMKITSALRTLPQQYLLRRWAANKRCGVTVAASVGESNHEGGMAVDISIAGGAQANKKIRASMAAHQFTWLGADDPVHYDYNGTGVPLQGMSVIAFKRLWNRNHPEARLAEDETYNATVEAKLKASPAAGFPIGARCDSAGRPEADRGGKAP